MQRCEKGTDEEALLSLNPPLDSKQRESSVNVSPMDVTFPTDVSVQIASEYGM